MVKKYKCPCCGYLTMPRKPPGTFDICPVCFWEDDPIQFQDINYVGGANKPSLKQARENFLKFGACEQRSVKHVRRPLPEEMLEE